MLAPVYRHLDARGGVFGLSALEWAPVLLVAWVGMARDRPNLGVLAAVALYAGLRLVSQGRPENHLQHLLTWRLRRGRSGGRLSAAARVHGRRFPFGPYAYREVAPSSVAQGRGP